MCVVNVKWNSCTHYMHVVLLVDYFFLVDVWESCIWIQYTKDTHCIFILYFVLCAYHTHIYLIYTVKKCNSCFFLTMKTIESSLIVCVSTWIDNHLIFLINKHHHHSIEKNRKGNIIDQNLVNYSWKKSICSICVCVCVTVMLFSFHSIVVCVFYPPVCIMF